MAVKDHKCIPHPVKTLTMQPYDIDPSSRLGRAINGELLLSGILGIGAYGVVYTAVDTNTSEKYAVKCICKYNTQGTRLSRRQMNRRLRELSLHCKASTHPNIVPIFKVIDDYDGIYVVMEYCPEGDLFWNICHRGRYVGNDQLCKAVYLQILDAVEHCHNVGIYHRDLKPENILVAHHGWTVKLTDFGLATTGETSSDFGCGSERYMSPGKSSRFTTLAMK
jgi:serine/threonine protein kinase